MSTNPQFLPVEAKSAESILADIGFTTDNIFQHLHIQPEDIESAWLAGSLVEGLGNPGSDIDIYVIVKDLEVLQHSTKRDEQFHIDIHYFNDRRLDYEYWSVQSISRVNDVLMTLPVNDESKNILDTFAEHEVDFIHRLYHSVPLINYPKVEDLRRTFSQQRFVRYLMENKRIYIDDAFDDSAGMFEVGHFRSAALRARFTVENAVDMFLYSYGITNPKDKHRIRLLTQLAKENSDLTKLVDQCWQYIVHIPSSLTAIQKYTKDALEFSEHLVDIAQTRSYHYG